jgi:UDP-2,3-diacylglucosamine pyrophosphatase LpxH
MKRLIISDLHLGSRFSNELSILELFNTEDYDELILAGDIIDFIRIPKFTKDTLKILNTIFNNFKKKKQKIIYVVGNHDIAFTNFIENDIADVIEFKKRYDFIDNNKKIRIEHGDDYDNIIIKWEFLMNIICVIANIFERFFNYDISKKWEQLRENTRDKINIYNIMNKNHDVDIFIMGHTHDPKIITKNFNTTIQTYANSGDWVSNNSYIIIENGDIDIKYIK